VMTSEALIGLYRGLVPHSDQLELNQVSTCTVVQGP